MEPSSKLGRISLFLFLAPSSPSLPERGVLAARNSSRFRSERGTRTKADMEGDGSRFIGVKSSHAGAPKQFNWNKRVVIQFISCPSPLPAIEPFKRTIHPNLFDSNFFSICSFLRNSRTRNGFVLVSGRIKAKNRQRILGAISRRPWAVIENVS